MTTTEQTSPPITHRSASVTLADKGASSVTIDGMIHPLRATDTEQARGQALELLRDLAAQTGDSISVTSHENTGVYEFLVAPDGSTHLPTRQPRQAAPPTPSAPPQPTASTPPTPPPPPARPTAHNTPQTTHPPTRKEAQDTPETIHPPKRKEVQDKARMTSLLESSTASAPATHGLRGILNTMGLSLPPSHSETIEREHITKVSQHWAGPRTIAVVNGKGGSSKTPTAILLAALLARYGAGNVIAWDNNSTRGTLGWRTEPGPHQATVADLIPHADHLLSPQARAADLAAFTHHQSIDHYDVLRSDPTQLAIEQPTDEASFRAVHSILARYYRAIIIDTGNDESLPAWAAMIERCDAIMVPTITRPEHAESARLLLDNLARSGPQGRRLADQATVVVTQAAKADPKPNHYVKIFRAIARTATGIPYDPAMSTSPLLLDHLAPATRSAWLAAGAALTEVLTPDPNQQ